MATGTRTWFWPHYVFEIQRLDLAIRRVV